MLFYHTVDQKVSIGCIHLTLYQTLMFINQQKQFVCCYLNVLLHIRIHIFLNQVHRLMTYFTIKQIIYFCMYSFYIQKKTILICIHALVLILGSHHQCHTIYLHMKIRICSWFPIYPTLEI